MKNILTVSKLDQYIETFEDEDLLDLGLKKPHIKRLRRYFEENEDTKTIEIKISRNVI